MLIAICDDNVADRKQLERLMSRQAQARMNTSENLYVTTYGTAAALLETTMLYDVYFLDVTDFGNDDALSISKKMRKKGIDRPIVLMSGQKNYEDGLLLLPDLFHLKKPIAVKELTDTIDKCIQNMARYLPRIELRGNERTYYLLIDEVLYLKPAANARETLCYLTDGNVLTVQGDLINNYKNLFAHKEFCPLSAKLINAAAIKTLSLNSLEFTNGEKIKLKLGEKKLIAQHMAAL